MADERLDIRDVRDTQRPALVEEKPSVLSSERVLGSYRSIGTEDTRLREGIQLYNEGTRTIGTVSGNITVLVDNATLADVAAEFGLNIVYQDRTVGIGQLNAAGHDDLEALVEAIRASGMVRVARVDVIEQLYEPHVIAR